MPSTPIPVIIIGFRNPSDVCRCLSALAEARPEPAFEPFICENGGSQAYDALVSALSGDGGPCPGPCVPVDPPGQAFVRACKLKLAGSIEVAVGEARGNLGYAGGINAWVEVLLNRPGWPGLWILNPDTAADPDALAELVDYAQEFDKGMVGSRIMSPDDPDRVGSRGLAWNHWASRTTGVDKYAPATLVPDRLDVERRIDGPHGASFYVTRACVEKIGLKQNNEENKNEENNAN